MDDTGRLRGLGNQWPVTPEVPNAPALSFCKANFSGIVPSLADEAEASRRVLESNLSWELLPAVSG